jgi:tetratricopeptide (TPR) repeat protein
MSLDTRRVILLATGIILAVTAHVDPVHAQKKAKAKEAGEEEAEAAAAPIVPKDVCLEPSIMEQMKECPSGAKAFKAKKAKSSGPKAVKAKEVETAKAQEGPGFGTEQLSDEISAGKAKKAKEIEKAKIELLKKALQQTKLLVKSMSDDNDKKPVALHQMAEKCFDLQQKYYFKARELDETKFKAEQSGDPNLVKKVLAKQKELEDLSEKYRLEAMEYYKVLIRDFPDYESRDTVLFNLAYAFDELSKTYPKKKEHYAANAREVYYVLIKEYPDSKYIPHAWLSFAEYYFMEGKGDSMGKALKFYKEVTKYPETSIFAYALYKQAWCLFNMQDYNGTLNKFIDVIDYADQHPEDENARQLQKQVRKELHMPYSQVKPPDHAWEFFSRYGGDQAVAGMENLADSYFNQGFWKDAIVIFHKLMAVEPGSDSFCNWQYMITFATNSLKNKEDQLVELKRMTSVYEKFAGEGHAQDMKDQCLRDVREMVQNQAFAWHREAVGTDTQPGTNDLNTMKRAIDAYDVLLKFHDDNTSDWERVPQTGPEDTWVSPYDIAYYKAELLWNMEDWVKCGPAYDKVVEMNPEGQYMEEAAYAAVLCYNRLYHMYHKDDKSKKHDVLATGEQKGKKDKKGKKKEGEEDSEEFAEKKISSISEKMLAAFTRYTCYVEESEDLPDVMYQKARIYYEANHYQEASYWYKQISYNFVNSEVGPFAANLYLDSLYGIMLQDRGRSVPCLETIADAANDFITIAKFQPYMEDPLFKQVVFQLKCNTERKKAEAYQEQKNWKEAALTYKTLYEKWGQDCDERLDEVLFNMGITFQAANLLGQAIKWRKVLIDKYPESEHAKKAVYEVGANYHAIAMYEQAADYYEKFSSKYPGEDEASLGLENATAFRLGLGQYEKALDDAGMFIKNYSSGKKKKPIEVAKVAFSIGQIYKRQKDWGEVIKSYDKFVKRYKQKGVVDLRIRAYVEMAEAWKAKKKSDQAMKLYVQAAKIFSVQALADIEGAGETDEEREKDKTARGGLMLDAGSEALFHQGELIYEKFNEIKFPVFDPDKIKKVIYSDDPEEAKAQKLLYTNKFYNESKEAWLKHKNLMHFQTWSKTDLKEWAEKKVKAKSEAEAIYGQVLDYKVPRWVIASAARLGDMYRQFFEAYYNAPVPDLIKEDPELLDLYNDQRDQDALQYKEKAITGFQICLEEAKKNQWFNEWSILCEEALNQLDPKAFSVSSEMRAMATYSKEYVAWPGVAGELKTQAQKAEEAALTGKEE